MNDNPYQSPTGPPESPTSAVDVPLVEVPIVARYTWTADELIKGFDAHRTHIYRRGYRVALTILYAFALLVGVVWLLQEVGPVPSALVAILILCVYLFFVHRGIWKWRVRRQFAKRPDAGSEIEWRFTPEIVYQSTSATRSEQLWKTFVKMVDTPEGVLLYPNPAFFHWIPRHAFESDLDYARFLQLAESRIQRCCRVK